MTRSRLVSCAAGLVVVAFAVSACSTGSDGGSAASTPSAPATSSGSPSTSTSPSPTTPVAKQWPKKPGPAVPIRSIAPAQGESVGVAMPISVVFGTTVAVSARKAIEKHLQVNSTEHMEGAWHWFGVRRVDFRPKKFWTPGTKVSFRAKLGGQSYHRTFHVGADVRTHVIVNKHKTIVRKNGVIIRTMRSNAGSPALPTWTGTMAVVNKAREVRMDSCSVGLACSPGSSNYYDLTLPWDVRLTWSGTFLHYSTGDPHPGGGNGSHGCVHLSLPDAEWFYNLSKPGDPVKVTGSPRGKADADNGYAGFNLTWHQWVAGSTTGFFTT